MSADASSKTDRLVREGAVRDCAGLARLGHVSRARVTQIMNLNFLAPDIQEDLLFLPRVERGRDPIREHAIRPIAAMFDWRKQRKEWRRFASQLTRLTSGECAALGVAGENSRRAGRGRGLKWPRRRCRWSTTTSSERTKDWTTG